MGSGIRTGIRYAQETIIPSTWTHGHIREVLDRFGATDISFTETTSEGVLLFTCEGRALRIAFAYPDYETSSFRINGAGKIYRNKEEQDEAHDQIIRCRWRTVWYWIKAKFQAIENQVTTFEEEFGPYVVKAQKSN